MIILSKFKQIILLEQLRIVILYYLRCMNCDEAKAFALPKTRCVGSLATINKLHSNQTFRFRLVFPSGTQRYGFNVKVAKRREIIVFKKTSTQKNT